MSAKIALFPGDGIGPEVAAEAVACLRVLDEAHGLGLEFEEALVGGCAIDAYGKALPDEALTLAREADAVLLGAVGGPKWDDPNASERPERREGDPPGSARARPCVGAAASCGAARGHAMGSR